MFEEFAAAATEEDKKRIEKFNSLIAAALKKQPPHKPQGLCRDMSLCFRDGQRIQHTYKGDTWIATYNKTMNTLTHDTIEYSSLSKFALTHCRTITPDKKSIDGWLACKVETEPDTWISTAALKEQYALQLQTE